MKPFLLAFILCIIAPVFSQTLVPYHKKNGKFIYVDSATMNPLSGKEWEYATFFDKGSDLAAVKSNKKWAVINRQENFIIQPDWGFIMVTDGIIYMQKDNTFSIKNFQLRELIPAGQKIDGFFFNTEPGSLIALYMVKDNQFVFGFMDKEGKIRIPFEYSDYKSYPPKPYFAVKKNEKWGFIDTSNSLIVPCEYENVEPPLEDNIITAQKNGKWGYIDSSNKLIIPFMYTDALPFRSGLSRVNLNGKWGYVNKSNDVIIDFQFEGAGPFIAGLAYVKLGGKYGLIDTTGKYIVPASYEFVSDVREGRVLFKQDKKYGFFNKTGNVVIPAQFDAISRFNEGLCFARRNNETGYIDSNGVFVILPDNYKKISMKDLMNSSNFRIVFNDFYNGFAAIEKHYYAGNKMVKNELVFYIDKTGRAFIEK